MADDSRMTEQVARRYCRRCGRSVLATRRVPEGAVLDPFVIIGTLGLALLFRKTGLDAKLEPFRCPSCGDALSGPIPAGTQGAGAAARTGAGDTAPVRSAPSLIRTAQQYVADLAALADAPGNRVEVYNKGTRDGILYYYGARISLHVDKLVASGNAARALKLLSAARPYRWPRGQRIVRALFMPMLLDLIGACVVVVGLAIMMQSARSREWPTAEGRVLWSGIDTIKGDESTTYRAAARYTYTVNDVRYEGGRVSFDIGGGAWDHAAKDAARYAPGTTVTVYYNPSKPSRAVLEPGMSMAGLLVAVVGASLLLSSGITIVLLVRRPLAEARRLEQRLRGA